MTRAQGENGDPKRSRDRDVGVATSKGAPQGLWGGSHWWEQRSQCECIPKANLSPERMYPLAIVFLDPWDNFTWDTDASTRISK